MEILKPYRAKIDALDDRIIDLLVERMAVINDVAHLKSERDIPAVLEDRVREVIERCAARAQEKGMDPELARRIYAVIVAWCCDVENEFIHEQQRTGTASR